MILKNRYSLIIILLCIGLSTITGLAIFIVDPNLIIIWFLVLLLLFQVSIAFTGTNHTKRSDPLNLLVLISSMYFLYFVARTVFLLFNPVEMVRFGSDAKALLLRGLLYTNIGFASLLIGYYSSVGRRIANYFPPLACNLRKGDLLRIVFLLYAVGSLMRLIVFSKGWHLRYAATQFYFEVPAWFRIIDYLTYFSFYGFLLVTLYVFYANHKRTSTLVLWYIMLGVEIIYTALGGSKFAFFFILLAPLMACNYSRKKMKLWPLLAVGSVTLVVIVFPILKVYRSTVDYETIVTNGYSSALSDMFSKVALFLWNNPWTWLEQAFVDFINRLHGTDVMMAIIASVPNFVDYQYGKTLLAAVGITAVPTFLWPSKYEVITTAGNMMAYQIWNFGNPSASGIAVTQIGELYMNFGILGIIIGMFIIGVFYRFIYIYLVKHNMHFIGLFLYIYIVYWILPVEFEFVLGYGNIFKQMIFLLPIVWILNRGRIFDRSTTRANIEADRGQRILVLGRQVEVKPKVLQE